VPTRRMASRETIPRIIRLGFPEWTVWAIPLTAHEFGHVVLKDNSDLNQRVKARTWALTEEERDVFLADAFATCAMGPAYAYAAVLLNFDPCAANRDERTEALEGGALSLEELSPDSRRAHVVISTLALMGDAVGSYETVRAELDAAWKDALEPFGLRYELPKATRDTLDGCAHFMWDFLTERGGDLVYKPEAFQEVEGWPSLLDEEFKVAFADFDVRDVLNAAWRERIRNATTQTGGPAVALATAAQQRWRDHFAADDQTRTSWKQDLRGEET
jgi:hypothetical protein